MLVASTSRARARSAESMALRSAVTTKQAWATARPGVASGAVTVTRWKPERQSSPIGIEAVTGQRHPTLSASSGGGVYVVAIESPLHTTSRSAPHRSTTTSTCGWRVDTWSCATPPAGELSRPQYASTSSWNVRSSCSIPARCHTGASEEISRSPDPHRTRPGLGAATHTSRRGTDRLRRQLRQPPHHPPHHLPAHHLPATGRHTAAEPNGASLPSPPGCSGLLTRRRNPGLRARHASADAWGGGAFGTL